ncbi:hypothetical protein [Ferrimonas marina]|uniref:Uncharacterized protein n=1 Tax=Ferrimonas marina TaxID=299255 RepID=A0A1M5MVU2_9GAMM|nr:hypothetical protein [Ferrimonas marina]SHG81029.1 hypothetical protein SAMN02745129_0788 [Ferrimonas marina]
MQPIGWSPVNPGEHKPVKSDANGERVKLDALAPVSGTSLVVPKDSQGWEAWHNGRDRLHQDRPFHPGLAQYQAIADDGLRNQLQRMVGVDLYV